MAVDGRRQRLGQQIEDVPLLLGQVLALQDVVAGDSWAVLGPSVDQVVGQEDGLESAGGVAALLARKATEDRDNLTNTTFPTLKIRFHYLKLSYGYQWS